MRETVMAGRPNNVFINEADVAHDLVFRKAVTNNSRSLSGVISHEVTHLLVCEQLFTRDINQADLEATVLATL